MFRKLLADTVITAAAFLIASVIGLLLVPLLIGAYGVRGLGLIVLARVLVPAGALGILDFGLSEIAMQAVATARALGEWATAKARLRLLAGLTAVLVAALTLAIYILAAPISQWFEVPLEAQADFTRLVRATAIALPLLFAGLVFEGIIKGFEKFSVLRSTEIVSTLVYASLVLLGIRLGKNFAWPAWAFLAIQAGRALAFGLFAWRLLPNEEVKGTSIDRSVRQYVLERGRLLFTARIMGTLQHQAPTLLIGVLIGPAAVGIYEVILRLPRFLKSALAIIGMTIMPAAVRLDAAGDHGRLQLIGRLTITLLPTLIFPPLAVLAVFSGDVLGVWLGRDFLPYAPWLAACLIVPAFNTIISFQNSTLLNRLGYLRKNNLIAIVQTTLQMAISLALVHRLAQNAFIVGQVAGALAVFVWQVRLGQSYLNQSTQLTHRFFAFVALTLLVVPACIAVLPPPLFMGVQLYAAVAAAVTATILLWTLAFSYFLTADGRAMVRIAGKPLGRV